jgi:hypothetical protein
VLDENRGAATYLVQGQAPSAVASAFTGSAVALMDAWFRVAVAPGRNGTVITEVKVGSAQDPIYLSSLTSNGDDISEGHAIAQVSRPLLIMHRWPNY